MGLPQGMCMGAGLGQSLNCLMSSHSGSRCKTTTVPGHDFSGSMLVDLCKQQLRDTKANHWHSKVEMGPTVVCFVYQRNECRRHSRAALTGEQLQQRNAWLLLPVRERSTLICLALRLRDRPGASLQQPGSRSRPWQGTGTTEQKEGPTRTRSGRLWSPQHQSHLPPRG